MLLLNGKIFDPASKLDDEMVAARAHYLECVKQLRNKFGKYGQIKLVRRKGLKKNPTGLYEPVPMIIFPAKVHTNVQFASNATGKDRDQYGGMETWSYSAENPVRKDGEYQCVPKSIKVATYELALDLEKDIELIYFLLFKCPQVYYPEAINKYGKIKKGELIIDDKDEREARIAEGRKAAAKLNHAIYGDKTSPLFEVSTLRATAAAWGVEGALSEKATEDEVRNNLFADVERQQKVKETTGTGRGIEEFLDFVNYDDIIKARALVLHAIDAGIIQYDKVKFTYIYESTGTPLLIVPEKAKGEKFDYLCQFLLAKTNAPAWEKLRKEVITPEFMKGQPFTWIKWLAEIEELPIAGKSEKDLRAALVERYL
jgi:hypothetical protein